MPKRRYERHEPTHEWQQIRPLLKDTAQINYEVILPVILWGVTPKERGAQTGVSPRTIYYRANLFDQAGMASLLPAEPPPPVPKLDKRSLPPDVRQEIVDLHAQYPAFHPHEIATICFVKFNRKPAPATIKLILPLAPNPRRPSVAIRATQPSRREQSADYHQERLSRYSVEWHPDDRHLARVGNPRLYQHRYQSAQLELWEPGEIEWFVIIRTDPKSRRRSRRSRILLIQPPLFSDGTQG